MRDPERTNTKPCVDCGNTSEASLHFGPDLMPSGESAYLCPVCRDQRAHWYRTHETPKPLPPKPGPSNTRCCP